MKAAAGLPKEEAAILIEVRSNLIVGCTANPPPDLKPPQSISSALARDFASYITGANAFYAGDFAAALKSFDKLNNSMNSWLKETSRYMLGRTLLSSAQSAAFGEWGVLKLANVNKDSLKSAEDAFNSYIYDFPRGMYGRGRVLGLTYCGTSSASRTVQLNFEEPVLHPRFEMCNRRCVWNDSAAGCLQNSLSARGAAGFFEGPSRAPARSLRELRHVPYRGPP